MSLYSRSHKRVGWDLCGSHPITSPTKLKRMYKIWVLLLTGGQFPTFQAKSRKFVRTDRSPYYLFTFFLHFIHEINGKDLRYTVKAMCCSFSLACLPLWPVWLRKCHLEYHWGISTGQPGWAFTPGLVALQDPPRPPTHERQSCAPSFFWWLTIGTHTQTSQF